MIRLRLFLFYTLMAWASVVRPAEGGKMIDDAEAGALVRWRSADGVQKRVDGPSNSTLALAATLALMVTGGWVALMVDNLLGWMR